MKTTSLPLIEIDLKNTHRLIPSVWDEPVLNDATGGDVALLDKANLLDSARNGQGIKIFIGSENKLFSLSGSSVIAAPYRGGDGRVVGVVGVIGPTRLNYARIVPMVDFTAQALTRMLM